MFQFVSGPYNQLLCNEAVSHGTREEVIADQRQKQSRRRAIVGRDTSNRIHGLSYRLEALHGSCFFRIPHSQPGRRWFRKDLS